MLSLLVVSCRPVVQSFWSGRGCYWSLIKGSIGSSSVSQSVPNGLVITLSVVWTRSGAYKERPQTQGLPIQELFQ